MKLVVLSLVISATALNIAATSGDIPIAVHQPTGNDEPIKVIKRIFDNYAKRSESTDSPTNKDKMKSNLKTLSTITDMKELTLLVDVWMYYDPTDFPTRSLVFRVLKINKPQSISAVKLRMTKMARWEKANVAPFSELGDLLKDLEAAE